MFERVRRACGLRLLDQRATSLSDLADALRRGAVVVVMLDRRARGRHVRVRFLGCDSEVTAAACSLSRMTGAPILTAVASRHHGPTLDIGEERWAGVEQDDDRLMQDVARDLERLVRTVPHQWHVPGDLRQLCWTAPQTHPSREGVHVAS
jgi:lauroyl/myristoyl acyltransferase